MNYAVHNYTKIREEAAKRAPGKLPVLQFSNGSKSILLPSGQQVTKERWLDGPQTLTGKQLRKLRKAKRHQSRDITS